ncbi:MAG: redoxin domain-containing protein [Flavobacteriales bacterium]
MLPRSCFFLLLVAALCACGKNKPSPIEGPWVVELDLGETKLPFNWDIRNDSTGRTNISFRNGAESILAQDVVVSRDSVRIKMPFFDSEFIGIMSSDSLIQGVWANYLKGDDYRIPFIARAGLSPRFPQQSPEAAERFAGKWRTWFNPETPHAYNSVAEFHANTNGSVVGTFMTETGDYRYLAGSAYNDSLFLSCFDGSHAFLFKALLRRDSLIGHFWSGTHWQEPWVSVRNDSYHLRDPDSLSFMREGYDRVDFRFPDTEGVERSPLDPEYQGKPVLVHIMGSWCPNCLDETTLLREMHTKYAPSGLRIIAVAFEKHADRDRSMAGLRRFKNSLNVPYPILYGGLASKEEATRKLPFLQQLISYPTCIFIGRDGRVHRIRTGFYGPGTGQHYEDYKQALDEYLNELVSER